MTIVDIEFQGFLIFRNSCFSDSEQFSLFFLERCKRDIHLLIQILPSFSGSWAFIIRFSNNTFFAAVDLNRSIPVFFDSLSASLSLNSFRNNQLADSLFPHYLTHKICPPGLTLLKDVYVLRPGFYFYSELSSPLPYFKLSSPSDILSYTASNAAHSIFRALDELRLVLQSKPPSRIYIPLSGGMDSRLIACYLSQYRHQYKILCYTYGKVNSTDAAISQQVAAELSLPWEFIEYTPDEWAQVNDKLPGLLHSFPSCFLSPNLQELISISKLTSKYGAGMFLPGYFLDVPTGNYIAPHEYSRIADILLPSSAHPVFASRRSDWYRHFIEYRISFTLGSLNWFTLFGSSHFSPFLSLHIQKYWYNCPPELRNKRYLFSDIISNYYRSIKPGLLSIPYTSSPPAFSAEFPELSGMRAYLASVFKGMLPISNYLSMTRTLISDDYLGLYDLVAPLIQRGRDNHYHSLVARLVLAKLVRI
jgi:hypothetical protein